MNRRELLAASVAVAASGGLAASIDRLLPELTAQEVWVLWLATAPWPQAVYEDAGIVD